MRRLATTGLVVAVAVLLLLGIGIASGGHDAPQSDAAQSPASEPGRGAPSAGSLGAAIAAAQVTLRKNPADWSTWAQLGSAYVQQARITVDPSYYPKAAGALRRSLRLQPQANFQALVGLGALANARHRFRTALGYGLQAKAINPYNASVYGVLDDAYTQLGRYQPARDAVQHMLNLRPGVASFTRASYDFEEHGGASGAKLALQRALRDAIAPADIAYCRYYLGELAFNSGHLSQAAAQYAAGLRADAGFDPLLEGRAKVEAARGDIGRALRDYNTVIARVPQPQYVLQRGELQQSIGAKAAAARSYALLATEQRLFTANGVVDDLLPAQVDADHGDPAVALKHARAEWARRHSVLVADALAWALHVNGRDAQALHYSTLAGRLGWRNATFAFHRGMIEASLGDRTAARRDLTRALHINPYFSPLQAPVARTALRQLGGPGRSTDPRRRT